VHNTHFSRCFWALGNVAKYNGKPTPASGWRITTSRIEWEGQMMICSSSNATVLVQG
jgi:hypothetical protein